MSKSHDQIVIAQKKLTLLLGGLGMAMPSILYLGNLWVFGVERPLRALSTYYYSGMRDIFVGILFSMGVFLITYEGVSNLDRVLTTLASFFAFALALIPTHAPGTTAGLTSDLHNYAAAGFFGILTIMCLFRFTKIDQSRISNEYPYRSLIRNIIYISAGLIMFVVLLSLVVIALFDIRPNWENSAFWLEYAANIAFGFAFFVKGEGIYILNDDPIDEMSPWELYGISILGLLVLSNGFVILHIFILN